MIAGGKHVLRTAVGLEEIGGDRWLRADLPIQIYVPPPLTRDLVQEAQPQDNIELFAELERTEDKLAAIEDDEKINRRIPMDYSL